MGWVLKGMVKGEKEVAAKDAGRGKLGWNQHARQTLFKQQLELVAI